MSSSIFSGSACAGPENNTRYKKTALLLFWKGDNPIFSLPPPPISVNPSFTLLDLPYFSKLVLYWVLLPIFFMQPGQSFEKFKAEKMKKFDKDKDQKFSKQEVKNILDKTCWWSSHLF